MVTTWSEGLGLPLLIVVEGVNDIQFLKALSGMLHRAQEVVVDLAQLESCKQVLFVPIGGSNLKDWAQRLASLNKREFHLYDREQEPETTERQKVVDGLNARPGCVAVLTRKRALENYLHPSAILSGCGIEVSFNDNSDVANLVAQQLLARSSTSWQDLAYKGQRRLREKAKKFLNTRAVEEMTVELLRQRDPEGEVVGWFRSIEELIGPR